MSKRNERPSPERAILQDPQSYGKFGQMPARVCIEARPWEGVPRFDAAVVGRPKPNFAVPARTAGGGVGILEDIALAKTASTGHVVTLEAEIDRLRTGERHLPWDVFSHNNGCRRGMFRSQILHLMHDMPDSGWGTITRWSEEYYAPQLKIPAKDLVDAAKVVSAGAGLKLAALATLGFRDEREIVEQIDAALPDVDNIIKVKGEPKAHVWAFNHDSTRSVRRSATHRNGSNGIYIHDLARTIQAGEELVETGALPRNDVPYFAGAVMLDALRTADGLDQVKAHPMDRFEIPLWGESAVPQLMPSA